MQHNWTNFLPIKQFCFLVVFCLFLKNPLLIFLSKGERDFRKKKKKRMDQFLTYKRPNLGPVFNSTAYIYIYIYLPLSLSLSPSLAVCLALSLALSFFLSFPLSQFPSLFICHLSLCSLSLSLHCSIWFPSYVLFPSHKGTTHKADVLFCQRLLGRLWSDMRFQVPQIKVLKIAQRRQTSQQQLGEIMERILPINLKHEPSLTQPLKCWPQDFRERKISRRLWEASEHPWQCCS